MKNLQLFFLLLVFILFIPGNSYCEDISTLTVGKVITLHSKVLQENRQFIIRLPGDYKNSGKSYSVLYLLDAQWEDMFLISAGTIGYLSDMYRFPKLIIVGIYNSQRNRDMLPTVVKDRPNSGGSDRFLKFLGSELIPYINNHYRTKPFSILYGGSNAGLFTLYALLKSPHLFQAYIAGSPMIGHCRDFIYSQANQFIKTKLTGKRHLFFIYGKDDFSKVTQYVPGFKKFIESNHIDNLNFAVKIILDDGHVPYTSLFHGLRFIFSKK
jgi:predicted alpha/beta superfamily hydrolase